MEEPALQEQIADLPSQKVDGPFQNPQPKVVLTNLHQKDVIAAADPVSPLKKFAEPRTSSQANLHTPVKGQGKRQIKRVSRHKTPYKVEQEQDSVLRRSRLGDRHISAIRQRPSVCAAGRHDHSSAEQR